MSKRLPPISVLDELAAGAAAVLREHGLGAVLADSYAREIAQTFARDVGGRTVYVPGSIGRLSHKAIATRDAQIRAEYKGSNAHQLARRHGLSKRRIKQILSAPSNVVAMRRKA